MGCLAPRKGGIVFLNYTQPLNYRGEKNFALKNFVCKNFAFKNLADIFHTLFRFFSKFFHAKLHFL